MAMDDDNKPVKELVSLEAVLAYIDLPALLQRLDNLEAFGDDLVNNQQKNEIVPDNMEVSATEEYDAEKAGTTQQTITRRTGNQGRVQDYGVDVTAVATSTIGNNPPTYAWTPGANDLVYMLDIADAGASRVKAWSNKANFADWVQTELQITSSQVTSWGGGGYGSIDLWWDAGQDHADLINRDNDAASHSTLYWLMGGAYTRNYGGGIGRTTSSLAIDLTNSQLCGSAGVAQLDWHTPALVNILAGSKLQVSNTTLATALGVAALKVLGGIFCDNIFTSTGITAGAFLSASGGDITASAGNIAVTQAANAFYHNSVAGATNTDALYFLNASDQKVGPYYLRGGIVCAS